MNELTTLKIGQPNQSQQNPEWTKAIYTDLIKAKSTINHLEMEQT